MTMTYDYQARDFLVGVKCKGVVLKTTTFEKQQNCLKNDMVLNIY